MSEFRIVKKSDIPGADRVFGGSRPSGPLARLHKTGTLHLSVLAVEPLGIDADCYVLAEYDEISSILKLTVPDKLPRGVSQDDCFPMRVRKFKGQRPMGVLNMKLLLSYIGFTINGGQRLEIAGIDAKERSISLMLPMSQAVQTSEAAGAAS